MHSEGRKRQSRKLSRRSPSTKSARRLGVAELLAFYCECAAGFCQEVDHQDAAYLDALVRTFKQALQATGKLPGNVQNGFLARLGRVRSIGRQLGNGALRRPKKLSGE